MRQQNLKHAIDGNKTQCNYSNEIPYFKVNKTFFFGGMKKEVIVPLSTPDRVIVEPNPPRQGYSHLTWKGLNEYYLQKSMTRAEYNEILVEIKKEAFRVYAINREENRFIQDSIFDKFSKLVWLICTLTIAFMFF